MPVLEPGTLSELEHERLRSAEGGLDLLVPKLGEMGFQILYHLLPILGGEVGEHFGDPGQVGGLRR